MQDDILLSDGVSMSVLTRVIFVIIESAIAPSSGRFQAFAYKRALSMAEPRHSKA